MLTGRRDEQRALEALVDAADTRGGALVVLGEPGMGKTALLEFTRGRAAQAGCSVVAVQGVESEAVLPFGTLSDLLLPLRHHLPKLPASQRSALEVCLALSDGPAAGPLAACAGTLAVLAAAAEEQALVVLVDDLQWVDPESLQALLFVARRLPGEQVAMVAAVREEPGLHVPTSDLPVLRLEGLSRSECGELAAAGGTHLRNAQLQSLFDWTGGNPLAVLEHLRETLPSKIDEAPGAAGGPALHASLERTWGKLFDRLPADTQQALFVVAADHVAGGRHTAEALGGLGMSLHTLDAAEESTLVISRDGHISLRHPLLRSVVFARTPLSWRVAAYRALATTSEGHLRSWYLAAAAIGPDATVAAALVDAANDARQRSGFGAAARTLRRAADLTRDPLRRAELLCQAARDAFFAADPDSAIAWCDEAVTYRSDPVFAAEVERVVGIARTWLGDTSGAFHGMVRAAEAVRPHDPVLASHVLAEAMVPAALQGDILLVRKVAEDVEAVWNQSPEADAAATAMSLMTVAEAFVMTGDLDRAAPYVERAAALVRSPDLTVDLQGMAFLAQSLTWCEQRARAAGTIAGVVDGARKMAAPAILSFALAVAAELGWWTGRWTVAMADATEALQRAVESAQPSIIGYGLAVISRIEASRGEHQECLSHVAWARTEIEPRGVGSLVMYSDSVLGLEALGRGDLERSAEHLTLGWEAACARGVGNPVVIPVAGDLAEVLARTGQREPCERVIAWLDERAGSTGLAYPRSVAHRALGILAPGIDKAEQHFAEAIASLGAPGSVPFEEGRTWLSYGEVLRRSRRATAARQPLQRSLALFEAIGARPWADRAMAELEASGAGRRALQVAGGANAESLDTLTPQELQIARAAGRGLNNVEVAATLFVSRKTVEAHLTRAYRKLGIRSRTELARVLLANGISN